MPGCDPVHPPEPRAKTAVPLASYSAGLSGRPPCAGFRLGWPHGPCAGLWSAPGRQDQRQMAPAPDSGSDPGRLPEPRAEMAVPPAIGYDPVNPPEPISDPAIQPGPVSDPSILAALDSDPHMVLAPGWLRSPEPRGKCQDQATPWN